MIGGIRNTHTWKQVYGTLTLQWETSKAGIARNIFPYLLPSLDVRLIHMLVKCSTRLPYGPCIFYDAYMYGESGSIHGTFYNFTRFHYAIISLGWSSVCCYRIGLLRGHQGLLYSHRLTCSGQGLVIVSIVLRDVNMHPFLYISGVWAQMSLKWRHRLGKYFPRLIWMQTHTYLNSKARWAHVGPPWSRQDPR